MATDRKAYATQSVQLKSKLDKKLRRQANHKARQTGATLESVVKRSCSSASGNTVQRKAAGQMDLLYYQALRDMDKRTTLSNSKDPASRKARRALNDYHFDRANPAPGQGWNDSEDKLSEVRNKPARGSDSKARNILRGHNARQSQGKGI
ncbi:hypothetical protein D3C77_34350 [compost metagenome]